MDSGVCIIGKTAPPKHFCQTLLGGGGKHPSKTLPTPMYGTIPHNMRGREQLFWGGSCLYLHAKDLGLGDQSPHTLNFWPGGGPDPQVPPRPRVPHNVVSQDFKNEAQIMTY